jgi:hypothetical protein
MRVSLAPPRTTTADLPAPPLLDPAGAQVILGGFNDVLPVPIAPAAYTLFGPRGAALLSPDGPLVVADTGHHRLLVWRRRPRADLTPADLVIGQPGFAHERRNAGGEVSAGTLNVPTGVAACDGVLAVADAWNHRVLIWRGVPRANQPADVVLGQPGGNANLANRGATPGADTLNWCYGVAIYDGKLFVADTGNRRVLMWSSIPECHGAPADLVLGQRSFSVRDEGAGDDPGAVGMRWPHAVAMWDGELMIADAGNNRIMGWRSLPRESGAPCDYVLGQASTTEIDHNRGGYYPTAATLNMPYGLAVVGDRLAVADTASSRLVGFAPHARATNALARALSGQHQFCDKGDNRWAAAARDSVSWPYAIAACGTTALVADTGNNRVLLWEIADHRPAARTPCV